MSNADTPVMPVNAESYTDNGGFSVDSFGLTKREQFCLQMGVPETGDPDLDDIIRKGECKRIAAMSMQGICASGPAISNQLIASEAVALADLLLKGLGYERS